MAVLSKIKASDNVDYNIRDDYSTWGGRNLLRGTKDFYGWYQNGNTTFSDGIATYTAPISKAWNFFSSPCISFNNLILGKDITFSCEVKSSDYASLPDSGYPNISLSICDSGPAATNYSTRKRERTLFIVSGLTTDGWTKLSGTVENITREWLTSTFSDDGTSDWFRVGVWCYMLKSCQFRHFKLEIGTKATDWSPAPEDIARFIGNETIELYG